MQLPLRSMTLCPSTWAGMIQRKPCTSGTISGQSRTNLHLEDLPMLNLVTESALARCDLYPQGHGSPILPQTQQSPCQGNVPAPNMVNLALHKTDINQEKILTYAENIRKHGFNCSHLELDDRYTSQYGEFEFDTQKFPNASAMFQSSRQMASWYPCGRIPLWIMILLILGHVYRKACSWWSQQANFLHWLSGGMA